MHSAERQRETGNRRDGGAVAPRRLTTSRTGRAAVIALAATAAASCVVPPPPPPPPAPVVLGVGGARNFLGAGTLTMGTGIPSDNFWLAVSGGCGSKENGDRFQAQTDANYDTAGTSGGGWWASCDGAGTVPNAEYDPDGYFYAVTVPEGTAGPLVIEAYDAPNCAGKGTGTYDSSTVFTTTFTVRGNDNADPAAATVLATTTVGTGNCAAMASKWAALGTIDAPTPGTYFVQVQSAQGTGTVRHGHNGFSLRVAADSGFVPCTADSHDTTVPFDAACITLTGHGTASLYPNLTGAAPAFPLTRIAPGATGRTLRVDLWDPAEGSRAIQVLDPTGTAAPFTWTVQCWDPTADPCPDEAPAGGWSGVSGDVDAGAIHGTVPHALDVWGNGTGAGAQPHPQPGIRRGSTAKYSDRLVRITVDLPADIATAYGGATQWRIRYLTENAGTDRTTWSVALVD